MPAIAARALEVDPITQLVEDAKHYFQQAAGRVLDALEENAFSRVREYLQENPGLIRDAFELFVFVDSNLRPDDPDAFFAGLGNTDNYAHLIDTGNPFNSGRYGAWRDHELDGRTHELAERDDLGVFFQPRDPVARALHEPGIRVVSRPYSLSYLESARRLKGEE